MLSWPCWRTCCPDCPELNHRWKVLTCPEGFLCDTEASHCQLNPQLPEELFEAHEMRGIVTFWTDDELEYGEVWGTHRRDGDLQ